MKRFYFSFLISFFFLSAFAQATVKKVAILETVDKRENVPYGILLQVRSSLTYAISSNEGYEGYDRVDMSAITGEQNFQRTGMVNDEQIKRLGEMTGASYVLIAEAAIYDDEHIIIAAKILDVETGGVISSTPPVVAAKDPSKMDEACIKCSQILVGGQAPVKGEDINLSSSQSISQGQDLTPNEGITSNSQENVSISQNENSTSSLTTSVLPYKVIMTPPSYTNTNKAYIHIRRPFHYAGSGIKHFIEVMGMNIGNLITGGCVLLVVNPGYIELKDYVGLGRYAKLKDKNSFLNMSLDVEAGKSYYIKIEESLNKIVLESEEDKNKYHVQVTYDFNN